MVGCGVGLFADSRFDRRMAHEIDALLADDGGPRRQIVTEEQVERLPGAVPRWLRHSNVIGSAVPTTARLRQDGRFQIEGAGGMPFAARFAETPSTAR